MKWLTALATALACLLFLSLAHAQEDVDVVISPLGDGTIGGSATFSPAGDGSQTDVAVRLGGLELGDAHASLIYEGTDCAAGAYGAIVEILNPILGNPSGTGESTTRVALPLQEVAIGATVLVIHAGAIPQDDLTPIACGVIPSLSGQPQPTSTPAPEPTMAAPVAGVGFLPVGDNGTRDTVIAIFLAEFGIVALGAGLALRRSSR